MTGAGRSSQIAPHFLQILLLASWIWPQLQIGALALGAFLLCWQIHSISPNCLSMAAAIWLVLHYTLCLFRVVRNSTNILLMKQDHNQRWV